jgi:hypothetical protein
MSSAPPRSATLDLLIGIVGVWLAAGFLWDSWAHLHVAVETFFTPYHAIFYAAMLVGAVVLGVAALRNRARGYTGGNLLPAAYRVPLLGIPLFFLGGAADLIWHTVVGVEDRVDAVTSPTHLTIGLAVLLVLSAPIRSALAEREKLTTLRAQLPLLFALAAWLEFIHLGTAYAFDPAAARMYAPPNDAVSSPDYFIATTLVLYKTGSGVAIVILQTLILMAFTLWLVSRFRLATGALTLFFVLGNGMIAAALTNEGPLLLTYLAMSLVAGITGDLLVARLRPSPVRPGALRLVGVVIPPVYYATYFAVTLATGGTWWDWNLILGALVWSACAGGGLALLAGTPPRG